MSTQISCQNHFYFKLFSLFKQLFLTIHFRVSTVSISKTVQFQTIQFIKSTQLKYKYSLSKTFLFQAIQFNEAVLIQLSISTDFVYTQLNVKTVLCKSIQFSVNTVSMPKTFLFQAIQFSISTQFSISMPLVLFNQ